MPFTRGIINPSEYTSTTTIGELTGEEHKNQLKNIIKSLFDVSTKNLVILLMNTNQKLIITMK